MPKKKTTQRKDTESDSVKEKKEGGPLERQRYFMRQRSAVLRPREEAATREDSSHKDENEESAPEPASDGPDKKPS